MLKNTPNKRGNAFLVNIDMIDNELDDVDWDTIKGEYERNGQGKVKDIQEGE